MNKTKKDEKLNGFAANAFNVKNSFTFLMRKVDMNRLLSGSNYLFDDDKE